jgi:hypothetical protein
MISFERRKRDRFSLDSKIKYTLDGTREALLEGNLVNISAFGLCFNTTMELSKGQKIIFRDVLPNYHDTATVVWTEKTDGDCYKVGLQFK